jgi:hypothetical protein
VATPYPYAAFVEFWQKLLQPYWLTQPILPDWRFENITINEQNSGSPETEVEILGAVSYGREIGKLLDAVALLIKQTKGDSKCAEFKDVLDLQKKVALIKTNAVRRRVQRISTDLADLKANDPKAFKEEVAALKTLLSL